MSSTMSLNSYTRRRKSAEPRLERSISAERMIEVALQPVASRPANEVRSSHSRHRRVKSAQETRREQEASDVFPDLHKWKPDQEWGKTSYSEDFYAKKLKFPMHIRPISPTRRNNPHPSQEFIVWKFPSRAHQHKRSMPPNPETLKFINESFYEDYLDPYNTGSVKTEVPVTNVATIGFPGAKPEGASSIMCGIAGRKAHISPRHVTHKNGKMKRDLLKQPSAEQVMVNNSVRSKYIPMLQEWLKIAPSKERAVVLEMLQEGQEIFSEEFRLTKAVTDVLEPESVECVQNWLKTTKSSDRKVLLNVLETLKVATGEGEVQAVTYPALFPHLAHHRQDHPHHHSGKHSGHERRHRHGHTHSCPNSAHTGSKSKQVGSGLGLVGMKIGPKERPETNYDEKPVLWQNRINRPGHQATLTRGGGIFDQPYKPRGQHFTIHPEWPTA